MDSFKIISDSACDLSKETLARHDVGIVPFGMTFDGEHYLKENVDITLDEFYHTLRTRDVFPKTSQPSIQEYMDAFKDPLDNGQGVLCFSITSKFSGSYQSAANAKNAALEDYPDARIYAVDSMLCTGLQGSLILEAARMRENGFTLAETYERCELLKETGRIYLTVDSLQYLQKGGRIGKASALAGSLLNIKPIIAFKTGELLPAAKVRGRKKATSELINILNADIGANRDDYLVFIVHSDELEEAGQLKKMLEKEGYSADTAIYSLGFTIGSHIGPTVIGLGHLKKYDSLR